MILCDHVFKCKNIRNVGLSLTQPRTTHTIHPQLHMPPTRIFIRLSQNYEPLKMHIQDIYTIVEKDFENANQLITTQLSSDVPLVEKIAEYIIESGGKRLRPLLVLLVSGALGYKGQQHIKLATIIEFLHTATLLHDDVVDTSDLRRGRSTANAKWGNAPSVLVGDFLYARAFQMMVELKSLDIMHTLAEATKVIAEGEVFQLTNCKNPDITEENYFEVIRNKTAMLFEAAASSTSNLCGANADTAAALKEYGLQLGLAFQLVDDMLDYTGNAETMGKNVGDDLAEGKPTLPLIQAMKTANAEDRKLIRKAIRTGEASKLEEICKIVKACGALEYTHAAALQCQQAALASLSSLPDSEYKQALIGLVNLAVSRDK